MTMTQAGGGQSLYFAYGSNLAFEQMARRCPRSRFVGRARLFGYQFQINERGYANVIKRPDLNLYVDGLCYRLTEADETQLDRAEGVPVAYQKVELEVEFFPASPDFLGRDVTDIIRCGGLPVTPGKQSDDGQGVPAKVMVYLSAEYVSPGRPWDEYIERMELGLQCALRMGISETYVELHVRPWLRTGKGTRGGGGGGGGGGVTNNAWTAALTQVNNNAGGELKNASSSGVSPLFTLPNLP
ncbi:hypothetical protein QBC46DRAFT_419930 [Diplogelasinospora grovesii]|uniref:gamma-glutamylcyclotransferase n=1 Tax=Diplogelasinospora grovesii TaxID=303347 RepID=A0AAN6S8C2_9PEZI|nr:hypothetical protein QBC46DRAFT_419930 [Diplogelasinospora grovesii]